ncbi:MAG TPA: hypothetical protein VGC65_10375 [Bacteroidia bacterium]|jgi:D-alanyl-lipoteichoic acid acyltransferase DltB (MBOAT superfamily)
MNTLNKLFPELQASNKLPENLFSVKRMKAFCLSLLQLCALLFIVSKFNIEKGSGITAVGPIIVGAFILSSSVSLRFRPAVLFATSVCVIYYAFGIFSGSVLMIGGLGLIACCHLPIKFWMRIVLILIAGIAMIILRADLFYAPRAVVIVPFLGSMFMFRLIIYLYEIKHGNTPATLWQRLSYFFLFPNLCFLLFPIIDYKTYLRTYYCRPDTEIWQKGIRWMLRGVIHLLCYRIIYLHLLISPAEVTDLNTLLQYTTCSFALVLRLSGLFHFIIGLLCLFGMDLHPVFNNYFLSTSFVDVWRRINIYWREFMMKIFYYPVMFKLKKKINSGLLPVTMIIVFIATWIMHNYQWFWARGYFPLTAMDILFWSVLGFFITINSMWIERNMDKPKKQINDAIRFPLNMLKILGVFLFMSFMWSLWNSSSLNEWGFLLSKMQHATGREIIVLFFIVVTIIVAGVLTQRIIAGAKTKKLLNTPPHLTLKLTLTTIGLLFLLSFKQLTIHFPLAISEFIASISDENENAGDRQANERGYYKALMDGEDNTQKGLWEVNLKRPNKFASLDQAYIRTNGLLPRVFRANVKVQVDHYLLETNSQALRDKNYPDIKQKATFRIALLGGSYESGAGVNNDEIFESLVEERLNKNDTDSIYQKIEIMNFAEPGYHLVQHVELCNTRIFNFKPDALIYVAHSGEDWRLQGFISDLIKTGADLKFPFLKELKEMAGLKQTMSDIEIKERLAPYIELIIRWSYVQIITECRKNNVVPVWAYLPTTADSVKTADFERIRNYALELGFVIMDLNGVYGKVDRKSIALSEFDSHPNPEGHRLIAEKFYSEFMKNKALIMGNKK